MPALFQLRRRAGSWDARLAITVPGEVLPRHIVAVGWTAKEAQKKLFDRVAYLLGWTFPLSRSDT